MFVCAECGEKALSSAAKSGFFLESYGPCELCHKTGVCKDVWSGADWAWASTAGEEGDATTQA